MVVNTTHIWIPEVEEGDGGNSTCELQCGSRLVEWRSSMVVNTTHIWIPEVEESDGGNYTCELQYGSRLVRRTTQLKVTGERYGRCPRRVNSLIAGDPGHLMDLADKITDWVEPSYKGRLCHAVQDTTPELTERRLLDGSLTWFLTFLF
ncbi:hypothetical protein NHX12_010970 [Muraenolepis orangiensis]|uniref:Ig-like domain-containing protein n=1 Tax=Muraenolepis orangiensis TaxID=630683 RepID=A0A9Q0DIS0_9TELE|nr:hypothetical protein NHX12_010970 [Muraenolepis orangiensis]